MNWYLEVLKKYAVFEGRAHRTEYWTFVLINVAIGLALGMVEGLGGGRNILSNLYSLAILVPSLAVSVRRLHDTGRSGWWLLLSLIPLAGPIILLVFMVLDSDPEANSFGPNPKQSIETIDI